MANYNRMRCEGKVGVVTGCTSGIGLATITMMVEEGAEAYMMVRNLEKAKPIAEELNARGPGRIAGIVYFDAEKLETIEPAIKEIYEKAGRIDMFVNNAIGVGAAGTSPDNDTVTNTSPETTRLLFKGIIGVAAETARVVIPLMIAGGGGSIVQNSSLTANQADTTRTYYGIAKSAVNMLTKHIALQYGRQGVRCNAVLPAFTAGARTLQYLGQEFCDAWLKHCPIRRIGKPEDQAKAIMFFATDDSEWVTGQLLEVSGGYGLGAPSWGDTLGG